MNLDNTFHYNFFGKKSGFTLVEVLVAIVILSIGLLALSKLQVTATQGDYQAYRIKDATFTASQTLESILSANYTSSVLSIGSHTVNNNDYTITYNVAEIQPSVKKIDLTITRSGIVPRSYSFSVAVADF